MIIFNHKSYLGKNNISFVWYRLAYNWVWISIVIILLFLSAMSMSMYYEVLCLCRYQNKLICWFILLSRICVCLRDKNQSAYKAKKANPTSSNMRLTLFYLLSLILYAQRELWTKYLWYESQWKCKKAKKNQCINGFLLYFSLSSSFLWFDMWREKRVHITISTNHLKEVILSHILKIKEYVKSDWPKQTCI